MSALSPFYSRVPKPIAENIAFRKSILQKCDENDSFRDDFTEMCRRDILFWLNCCGMIFEPRIPRVLPFITYPYQDDGILLIDSCIGKEDVYVFKSRTMGASWCVMAIVMWRWLFYPMQNFLILSWKENMVDSPQDPGSLFWKADFLLKWLPEWMRPTFGISDRTKMHMYNNLNGSVIDGESTTDSATIGDRRLAVIPDEFARFPNGGYSFWEQSQHVTNSRIPIFTPNGTGNAAADLVTQNKTKSVRWHWTLHPDMSKGLYKSDGTKTKPDHVGKDRSPWYDDMCDNAIHPSHIASQLDMDLLGSSFQFFDTPEMEDARARTCRAPYTTGNLRFDLISNSTIGYHETPTGNLSLWCSLKDGQPPRSQYVIGCDIAMGTGSSSSAAAVIDVCSGIKVAELVTSDERPDEFADSVYTLCRWFGEPFLLWEANGGGGTLFMKQIVALGYRNFFYRRQEDRLVPNAKGDQPGFWQTGQLKVSLAGQYRKALLDGTYIERSDRCIDECLQYVVDGKTIKHMKSSDTLNPADADDNHGDVAIATWLAVFATQLRPGPKPGETPAVIPVGCLAWEMEQERLKREADDWWPGREKGVA